MPVDPTLRLRALPWPALHGLGDLACQAIAQVLGGQPAERVIDRLLRAHRTLARDQRTALVEAIFGVALWRRRLAWQAAAEAECPPHAAPALLFSLLRDLAGRPAAEAASLAGLGPGALPALRPPPEALALRWSLPDWIARCFAREVGESAEELCAVLNAPGPICLRANLLRTATESLATRLGAAGLRVRRGAHSPLALVIEDRQPNLLGLEESRLGLFEAQDEGSQLLGLLVEAKPGHRVLDYCAGAGGKSLLLAAELRGEGELHVHDASGERLSRLERRAEKAGAGPICVHRAPPEPPLQCDRVLVDAPCSELGVLRRGPDARFRIDEAGVLGLPALQLGLLRAAARQVRPGGWLIYATCTLRREENEQVVAAFLREQPTYALRRPCPRWLQTDMRRGDFFACLPHLHGTDGFFAAVMERRAGFA